MAKGKHVTQPSSLQWLGEILITLGAIMLLYVFWQITINDPVVGDRLQKKSVEYSNTETQQAKEFVPIKANLRQGAVFAKIYVPRFGKDYERLIGQGTLQKVTLNVVGVGHYISTEWPGEEGNFAVAAHRTSHGAPFSKIDTLQSGDKVWVETNDSWFTYEYRQTAIVDPTEISVLSNTPEKFKYAVPGGHYMTMTSCHPKWSNRQRIVVWLELVNAQSKDLGKPLDLIAAQK